MHKFCFLLAAVITLQPATAQKKFDSAAYTQFYSNRWERPHPTYDTTEVVLSAEEKIAGLGKAWAEAKYNFANFDLIPNTHWDSLFQAYIPRVAAAPNTGTYYKVLQNFYQHLRDGHTAISLPAPYRKHYSGALPLQLAYVEGKVIVTKNIATGKEDAFIKPGMELVGFQGLPVQEYIRKEISPYLNFSTPQDSTERICRYELIAGEAGSRVALTLRTPDGKECNHTLTRIPAEQYRHQFPLITFKVLKGNIGYLQINSFNNDAVVRLFDSLFAAISKTDALVIDIRNNGGGNGGNGFEILGCLSDQPFYTGKTAMRRYFVPGRAWGHMEQVQIEGWDWKPYKKTKFTKPIILLTGAATYSAAEDFTSAFRSISRGKVLGTATGGSTGQPVSFTLPGGGYGYVCAKRDFLWDGTEFVGLGIEPDMVVRPTIKGITEERDEVLEAAVKLLQGQPAMAAMR